MRRCVFGQDDHQPLSLRRHKPVQVNSKTAPRTRRHQVVGDARTGRGKRVRPAPTLVSPDGWARGNRVVEPRWAPWPPGICRALAELRLSSGSRFAPKLDASRPCGPAGLPAEASARSGDACGAGWTRSDQGMLSRDAPAVRTIVPIWLPERPVTDDRWSI